MAADAPVPDESGSRRETASRYGAPQALASFSTHPATPVVPPDPRLAARTPKLREPVWSVADRRIPGPGGDLPLRLYVPDDRGPHLVVLHLHGGGWVGGGLANEDGLCRSLAARSGALVAALAYRLAPAHPYPAAVEDALAALGWLAAHAGEVGGDPVRLAVSGRSAGGTLAAAAALLARDRGGPPLAAQVLLVPATNHGFDTASYHRNAAGYGLTRDAMVAFWARYLARPEDGAEPYASPLRAPDLAAAPGARRHRRVGPAARRRRGLRRPPPPGRRAGASDALPRRHPRLPRLRRHRPLGRPCPPAGGRLPAGGGPLGPCR